MRLVAHGDIQMPPTIAIARRKGEYAHTAVKIAGDFERAVRSHRTLNQSALDVRLREYTDIGDGVARLIRDAARNQGMGSKTATYNGPCRHEYFHHHSGPRDANSKIGRFQHV